MKIAANNEDSYTVLEELKFISDDEERIDFLLNELSVDYLKNKPLLQLSSGEHRKFQLVKSLLNPPQLLILDEPCQGLDEFQTEFFINLVDDISRHTNTTMIYISHYENEMPHCISHVLELEEGKTIAKNCMPMFL